MFETQHCLNLSKEPVHDLRKEQPLPRKVIQMFSPKLVRDLKVLSKASEGFKGSLQKKNLRGEIFSSLSGI